MKPDQTTQPTVKGLRIRFIIPGFSTFNIHTLIAKYTTAPGPMFLVWMVAPNRLHFNAANAQLDIIR